jgi:hypothetical protein
MGIEKVSWKEIRSRVHKVNPSFANVVDKINPGEQLPLFLVSFPYGALIGDDISQFIPNDDGTYYRLNSPDAPKDIIKHLGYGKDSSPLGMIIDKTVEFFVDAKDRNVTIPKKIIGAGEFLNFSRILSLQKSNPNKPFAPNGLLKATAGARTAFSLPYLTCNSSFIKLERDVGELTKIPESQYDHFQLFVDIANNYPKKSIWELKLLYFSEKWIDHILNKNAWSDIKSYMFQKAWEDSNYSRNQYFFDVSFSMMKELENAKQNHYIYDTARHIFDIAVGAFPGLAPTTSNDMVPIEIIQEALTHSYGLKKYIPTIITPSYFSVENKIPVYYSMHYPTLRLYSPKTLTNKKSVLSDLQDLSRALNKFSKRICSDNSIWKDTLLYDVTEKLKFKFIHTNNRNGIAITNPNEIVTLDNRFNTSYDDKKESLSPALDGNFFRGSVGLIPE